jgi:hypothetical protein
MTGPQLDLMEGRRRRDREIEGHRERYKVLLEEIDRRLVALSKARQDGIVNADDAHRILDEMLEEPPWAGPDMDRTKFGGLWQGDNWVRVGYEASQRPACHARVIAQFRWEG